MDKNMEENEFSSHKFFFIFQVLQLRLPPIVELIAGYNFFQTMVATWPVDFEIPTNLQITHIFSNVMSFCLTNFGKNRLLVALRNLDQL